VVFLGGFLFVVTVSSTSAARRESAPRRSQLASLIQQRQQQVSDLDQAVRALRAEVATAEQRAGSGAAAEAALLAEAAGTTAARGGGVTVRLSDSARTPPPGADPTVYEIHDTDLQLVVNALFEAGARAVAVNDSRVVATTPIRRAGATIVVNFRPLSGPYSVAAVGADKRRFEASEIAQRFKRWTGQYGLGFSVDAKSVSVPAFTGTVTLSDAAPPP
jgi:uncharacterized protein YlxW (UPF0749 family)